MTSGSLAVPRNTLVCARGKDGYPYPVDRDTYDQTIEVLRDAIESAEIGEKERYRAIRRLGEFV